MCIRMYIYIYICIYIYIYNTEDAEGVRRRDRRGGGRRENMVGVNMVLAEYNQNTINIANSK